MKQSNITRAFIHIERDMMNSPFYTKKELTISGFNSIGYNVKISRKVSLYEIDGSIGNNVRVDDYCILKGRIKLGSYVHIAAFCLISGVRGVVRINNCSTISSGVHIYTGSDDYSANMLSSSAVPKSLVRTIEGDVELGTGSIVGAHSLLLPDTFIREGASIGAQCIVHGDVPRGAVIVNKGAKGKIVGKRDWRRIVDLAELLLKNNDVKGISKTARE